MESRSSTDLDALIAQAAGLRRLAVRLVGESEADDVVQDAVAAGIGRAPADPRALRPWLVRVVRNFAAGRRRGDARRHAREVDSARGEALPSAGDMVERMEVQRVVAEEVLRLDEPYRATVLALHFEGASAEDYAKSLGVPSATVRSWSKRGLDALRTRLDRRFGGDRAAWSACLLPLARPEAALIPLAIGGGILMKKLAVAAAVALVAGLAWWTFAGGAGRDELEPVEFAEAVDLAEPIAPPARSEPTDASAPAAPADVAARRVDEAARPAAPVVAGGRVTGRITWSPDGAPAVDVGVRLASQLHDSGWGSPPQVVTDRDGRFAFDDLAPDTYVARIDRSTVTKSFRVESSGAHEVDLAIPRTDDVVGRVLDADGVPVPGAEVHVRESNSTWTRRVAFAGADGGFRFEGADRWLAFFARAPGHAPSGMRQSVEGSRGTMDLYLGGTPARIAGLVLDPRGQPRAGALVHLNGLGPTGSDRAGNRVMRGTTRELRTDAAGRFEVLDAEPGPNAVRVNLRGFPWLDATVVARPGFTTETTFRLPAVARVRGRVTDAEGRALEGAYVSARSSTQRAWTTVASGPDGRFDTGCVSAGPVRLVASHASGSAATLDTELAPGADLEWSPVIGPFPAVRGRLVDLAGAPLAGRTVALSVKRTATTDAEGRFVFEALQPQEYSVWFTEGALAARAAAAFPGGAEVVLVAEPAGSRVLGRLVDEERRPVAGQRVTCENSTAVTSGDGSFEFAAIRSGTHSIDVRRPKFQRFTLASVDVRPGALHDVGDVVIPGEGSLRVRARSDEGVPLGWASPTLRRTGPGMQWVVVRGWGPDGEWVVEDLPAGEYELGVRDGGAAMQQRTFAIRTGERTEIELELRFGVVVEVDAGVATGTPPFVEIEFEFRDAAGVAVGRRAIRNSFGATSTNEWAVLAPGSYECRARTADGRTGRTRLEVGPDGAAPARIELR